MNSDAFESRLQQTPLRKPPAEWRNEILTAAADAGSAELHSAVSQICNLPDVGAEESALQTAEPQPNAIRRYGRVQLCATTKASPSSSLSTTFADAWRTRLRELFWPHPVAWGVIAVIWIAIGTSHLAMREPGQPIAQHYVTIDSDLPTSMTLQRKLLASWDEPADRLRTAPVRSIPPQSYIERRRMTLAA